MAVRMAFKVTCPSCQAAVPVPDAKMVGKKIDCPKCKDRFVVEKPDEERNGVAEEGNGMAATGKVKKDRGGLKPSQRFGTGGKAGKLDSDDIGEVVDEEDATPEEIAQAKKDRAKRLAREAREAKKGDPDGKTQRGPSPKLKMGMLLAGVGVVVLGLAAFLILGMRNSTTPTGSGTAKGGGQKKIIDPDPNENKKDEGKNDTTDPGPPPLPVAAPGAELTNLLPNDSEHVFHVYFKDLFNKENPLRDAAFNFAGAFKDDELRQRIGFSVLAIDDLIRAERFSLPAWSFTVVHLTEAVNEKALRAALSLEPEPEVRKQAYFKATKANPWFDSLARTTIGVPANLRQFQAPTAGRPLFVHVHNPQTLIFADEAPMLAFLQAEGNFKKLSDSITTPDRPKDKTSPDAKGPLQPPGGKGPPGDMKFPGKNPGDMKGPGGKDLSLPDKGVKTLAQLPGGPGGGFQLPGGGGGNLGMPGGGLQQPGGGLQQPGGGSKPPLSGGGKSGSGATGIVPYGTYLTVKPALKAQLDRMETRYHSRHKVLFSSATEMDAARISANQAEFRDRILWRPRQLWDVTLMLEEKKSRLRLLGTSLIEREPSRNYQFRNEMTCTSEADALELAHDLNDDVAPELVRFLHLLLAHKVESPVAEFGDADSPPKTNPGPNPGGFPGKQGPMIQESRAEQDSVRLLQFPGGGQLGNPGGQKGPPGGGNLGGMPGGNLGMPGGGNLGMPGGGKQSYPKPGGDSGQIVEKDDPKVSQVKLRHHGYTVHFSVDLVLDDKTFGRLHGIAILAACALRAEMDLLAGTYARHHLATAGKLLGEKGLSERGVEAGQLPPGAFKRPRSGARNGQEPNQRVSWMAGLLPYLGQSTLYGRIDFDLTWRDPANWLAARTIVPQFLDPSYPDATRVTMHPDLGYEVAATHIVGIAGVGLDAADYPPNDPAYIAKRGAFGYEKSATLQEIREGRGLSNTITMMQVPHDGPAGVTPWMAGGGATLRGVPEKNSIAPFVLSTDRDGKPITYQGKRGTFAAFADGSVRFIDASIADDVFKAMVTIKGPTPDEWDEKRKEWAPLVPEPTVKSEPARKEGAKEQPPVKEEKKATPAKEENKSTPVKEAPKADPKSTPPPKQTSRGYETSAPALAVREVPSGYPLQLARV